MLNKIIILLFISINLAGTWQTEPTVTVNPTAGQGEWFTVLIENFEDKEGRDARFQVRFLTLQEKELVERESFPVNYGFGPSVQAFIIGTYIEWPPGDYIVEIKSQRTNWVKREVVSLTKIDYPRAELRLDRALTNLLTQPDPRKEEEAKEFWRIINAYTSFQSPLILEFQKPVVDAHRTSSPFGIRRTYIYSTGARSTSYHWGVDYAAPTGTPVYAPAQGKVLLAKPRVVGGNTIMIEHFPGVISIYYHLDSIRVPEGQEVFPGDLIGTIGSTGLSTGPHLHFEVRIHGIPITPEKLYQEPLVRLPERYFQVPQPPAAGAGE
jgi:murein DD-endopeptidase MepM/ murein hydrolase activator NlpD